MNVGITAWGNRISPVFDSAQTLLVAEIKDSQVVDIQVRSIQPLMFERFLSLLEDLGIEVLICGALCRGHAVRLEASNIRLISFITGEVESVLDHYAAERGLDQFVMPGCGAQRCCRTGKVPRSAL
jgi:predicted Fe-Mo cluster-binding NifX family protein